MTPTESLEQATIRRVTVRLIPFIFVCYVIAYLDRVNISFASAELQRDLGLSDAAFGLGAGLFFLGYCLFEVPSNLILERVGARRWIARIMVGWGVVSMAMMFASGVSSFYLLRVLLGIAEAGFFPGVILYLTYWVPCGASREDQRALHDGDSRVGDCRRADLRGAAEARRHPGPARMAMAVSRRGAARRPRRHRGVLLPDRQSRESDLARAGQARVAYRDDGARAGRAGDERARLGAREPAKRQAVAVVRDLHDEHDSDIRRVPVAAAHPARRLEGQRPAHWMADGPAVCRGARGYGRCGTSLGPHRRAEVARRRLCAGGCVRLAAGRGVSGQRVDAGVELHAVAVGAALAAQRVLGHPADLPRRDGRRRRHRAHQLAGQSRWRRRPDRGRFAARLVGQLHVGPARAGRGAGHRGDPGGVDALATPGPGRFASPKTPDVLEHVRQRDHGHDRHPDDDGPG